MKKSDVKRVVWGTLVFVLGISISGCSSSQGSVKRKYNKVWNQMVRSEAWKDALLVESKIRPSEREDLYTTILDATFLKDEAYPSPLNEEQKFEERYHRLVSRAYFKIIAEAEKADERLRMEYHTWNSRWKKMEENGNRDLEEEYMKVHKRYKAHQKMLTGLKSWNILSEYGSDDLKFFKAENRDEVRKMFGANKEQKEVVNFLIYRLADLYHFENQ